MTDTRTCRTELMDAACCASRSSAATSTAASGVASPKIGACGAGGAADAFSARNGPPAGGTETNPELIASYAAAAGCTARGRGDRDHRDRPVLRRGGGAPPPE
jgi:hypothetical protein